MAEAKKIEIRIDARTKTDFKRICTRLGLSISAALKLFIQKSLLINGIPFEVRTKKKSKSEETEMEPDEFIRYINDLTDKD